MLSSKSLSSLAMRILQTANDKSRSSRSRTSQFQYEQFEPRQLLAAIAWSSGDITENRDVSVNGSLVFALNSSETTGATTRVNGVDFVSSTRVNAGAEAQTQSPGNESIIATALGFDNLASFTNGGLGAGGIGDLIEGGWWGTTSGSSAAVTLTGLTIGELYEVQLFSSDARTTRDDGYVSRLDNGAGGVGVDLELNNQPSGDRPGDFGVGVFTADSSTQSFNITGINDGSPQGGRIQVNAIQLRKLETVVLLPGAVPVINEFSASNAGTIDDDNGNSTDWIEIYNAGADSINLAGYTLTDDPTDLTKYVLPNTTLAGGQYLVVFAGDDADANSGSDLYTGFGLKSGGEYLGFYDPVENVVSEFGVGGADYPAQFTDVSYGFDNDNTFSVPKFFATPTPGAANVDAVDGVIETLPTVSVERGFYDQAFNVNVKSQTPGASLVYTTDGTEPSLTNGTKVDPADSNSLVEITLNISETTSLRTAAVREGFLTRGSTTHTYIFLNDVITSDVLDPAITSQYTNAQLRAGLLDIPTLSFNYETVIRDSDQPEQRASIEWLAPDGSEGFQINAGISGFGGNHISSQGFEKENYRVEFRNQYDGRLEFPLFEGFDNGVEATDSFESVEFRGGSHDRILRGFGLSNRFVDDTLLELGHAVPHGRFVHIYSNGEYFGQFHMRERWDADFLAQYYGGEEDDYEAVNGNSNGGNSTPSRWDPGTVYDGDGTAWAAIQALADTDGSGNPTGGYQELKEVVNLPEYLDLVLLYMSGNTENEYRGGGSVDGSVPYSFYLNDADGWIRSVSDRTGNAGPGNILGTLVAEGDPEFLTLYADRIQNLFGEGGVLSAERSVERLQNRIDETQLSFVLESARYVSPDNETRTPASFTSAANNAIENILPAIPVNMINRLRARGLFPSFDAPDFLIDGVFQNGGEIDSGDVLTLDANETIYYTTDGTDPRLVGGGINSNALAYDPGLVTTNLFEFGETWNYLDTGVDQGTAWRSSSFDDSAWSSNVGQFGYGNNGETTTVNFGGVGNEKYITTYFRKTFNVPAGNYVSATLNLIRDDGVVVYLDGVEIGRDNFDYLPANAPIDFDTPAGDAIGGTSEDTPISFPINLGSLEPGNHTLAIEVHQASITSSDLSFDAELELSTQSSGSGPLVLNNSTNVQARAFSNGEWSGLRNATFAVADSQAEVRISEIYYNPSALSGTEIADYDDNDQFEFIEILNPNSVDTINLAGLELANGVTFSFPAVDLGPGERAVVVRDMDAFEDRYGTGVTVLGEYTGGLNNGGERLELVDSLGQEISSVTYNDGGLWSVAADGDGASLVLDSDTTSNSLLGKYYSWRASVEHGGTPGAASTNTSGVVINEIVSHSDLPDVDSIELFNSTGSSINIGGWSLSDSGSDPFKYQIPNSTVLSAGGYLVFDQNDFDFALSALGEEVYLTRSVNGLPAFEDAVEFGATFNGDSVGRLPNGSGRLTHIDSPTLGQANQTHGVV